MTDELSRKVIKVGKFVVRFLYFVVVFGFIFPLGLGLLMEIFVVGPLKATLYGDTGVVFAFSWAAGLIYMKIGYRLLLEFPNNRIMVNVHRVFLGRRFSDWSIERANRFIVWPAFKMAFVALVVPLCIAHATCFILHLEGAVRAKLFRSTYPAVMLAGLVIFAMRESVDILHEWSQYVREQEYLVGRRLHNLVEEEGGDSA
ncbi:hypothetical protein BGX34_007465, partial [Mortierella sp. NVP85]